MSDRKYMTIVTVLWAISLAVMLALLSNCGGTYEGPDQWDAPEVEDASYKPLNAYVVVQPSGQDDGKAYRFYAPQRTLERLTCLELCECSAPGLEEHCLCPCYMD